MRSKSSKRRLGALFGLIFFVAGLTAAYFISGNMIVGYIASTSWVEVPAKIHDVSLVASNNDDSTTYTLKSSYSYGFDGVNYQNDRVSLSTGRDSFRQYWQELESSLLADQKGNEAFAFVNPSNPAEAVLDRTLRWKMTLFGLTFLLAFSGVGSFIMWSSLSQPGKKNGEMRLLNELENGIPSNQKSGNWFQAVFGGLFFVGGLAISMLVLPEALRKEEYAALLILLFVIVGAGFSYHAFKLICAYKRFGPTPLLLDPSQPGVGGQLSGRFSINAPNIGYKTGSDTQLQARLTCSRKHKSKNKTSYSILWQEEALVYLKQAASGVDTSFLFEIPNSCTPSEKLSQSSSIEWNVSVEGEFNSGYLGKFERNWQVVVGDQAAQASHIVTIPQSFIQNNEQLSERRAKTSALEQVLFTDDGQYISIHSKSGRRLGVHVLGMLFGVALLCVGFITLMQVWWPGFLFVLIGGYAAFSTMYSLGKPINVRIDKVSKLLHSQERWFGLAYASHQSQIVNSNQFKLILTFRSSSRKINTKFYVLNFHSDEKKIRIADDIEGENEAVALKDMIVDLCFNQKDNFRLLEGEQRVGRRSLL